MSAASGIAFVISRHTVDETVGRIRNILEARGVTLFALVDHSGEAAKAGLAMPNTKLVIFGNPAAGTALMQVAPTAAIDLPLKLLVAEDEAGNVTISWNDPEYLQQRHGFPVALVSNISMQEKLAQAAAVLVHLPAPHFQHSGRIAGPTAPGVAFAGKWAFFPSC